MGSKLRPLYDRIYIGTECWLNARGARQDARRDVKALGQNTRVSAEYDRTIRPYWRQFRVRVPKRFWFDLLANENRPFSPKYIPDDLWFGRIIPHYNNLIFAKALQDKCLYATLFPDVRQPVTVVKNIAGVFYDGEMHLLSREEAIARCHGRGRILAKPSVSTGMGNNIRFYDSGALSDRQLDDIFHLYGKNFLVQEKLSQHPDLARLNPSSLNTVRVLSFLHEGQVHILTAVLRVGGPDSEVDNTSQGGFAATVQPDGRLARLGQNKKWQYAETLPNGVRFDSVTIPSYDRIIAAVTRLASRAAHFKIIGWDMAVAEDGEPVLVEFNVIPMHGCHCSSPVFGELTDQVLEEVFGRRSSK